MLIAENTLLVVVDVQGKLVSLMHDEISLLKNLSILICGASVLSLPVLVSEQCPEKLGETVPDIKALLKGRIFIRKVSFSCYGSDQFRSEVQSSGKKQILVAGIETHVCIFQTVMDLIEQEYEVHVVSDAVSSRTPGNHQVGLQRIRDSGAIVTSTEMALFELAKIATGEKFREIIKLVR